MREVPAWSRDNHCFSCHNNGDAARALFLARRLSIPVPDAALADTAAWLRNPKEWDDLKGAGFSDKRLGRISFANSLADALAAGVIVDVQPLRDAVEPLLASQDRSGAWTVDAGNPLGLPATYGPVLATYMARRAMEQAGDPRTRDAMERATAYLGGVTPKSVMDASAIIMAFARSSDRAQIARLDQALELILNAQSVTDGGWGPFPKLPTEIFDSALALLALAEVRERPGISERIRRGRDFLIKNQFSDGSWTETTRPSGGRSYAEHISTCGWATLALLKTR